MPRDTLDRDAAPGAAPAAGRRVLNAPVVVEVRNLNKGFRIPDRRIDSLKERMTRPFSRVEYRHLQALRDVSFDVHRGEFFGITGRNGSGKSSLLKILASIYGADSGRVRTAGRVAPFIELGVGFNPELTARENGVLNGVLMGLTLREARRRLDAILEFAELREFVDLKLKNYSSGMMVRLAFAVMVQADADILLVDEVLAVGDAAFAQRCMDVFHERRRAGKTIVFVSHDMNTVRSLCDRAMLIHDGEVVQSGDPEETALAYYRLNFAGPAPQPDDLGISDDIAAPTRELPTRFVEAHLLDEAGDPIANLEQGMPIRLDTRLEARYALARPHFALHIRNEDGIVVTGFTRRLEGPVQAGQRIRLAGRIENPLVPGRYFLDLWVRQDHDLQGMAVQGMRLLSFVVFGLDVADGVVALEADVEPALEDDA